MKSGWLLLVSLIAVLTLAVACGDDGGDGEDTTTPAAAVTPEDSGENGESDVTSFSEDDPEYLLASIDAGEPLSVDDPSIGTYAGLLDSLDEKCEEEQSLIGDQAVVATQLLADEGITVTVLEALQGIDESIPEGSPRLSCAEIAATWVTLIVGQ
ncbi:MAG: hypothetical protein IH864_03270 [Chloroflexi bacterium]|nr:hypothetical protein [Chloroflexota bacterium]